MNYLSTGRIIFALAFIALAIQGMIMGDFNIGRPPQWPVSMARTIWSYIGGAIVIVACVAVLIRKHAVIATLAASTTIFVSIFLARNIPALLSAGPSSAFWSLNAFKTLALAGGACVVGVSFWNTNEPSGLRQGLLWFGIISLAYFLFICGLSHFKFVDFIRGGFIPAYIPFQTFWAYFTGICLLAGGIGITIKRFRRLAAILSGFMILGWFFLLHIPRAVAAPGDPLEWFGVFESFGFVGIFFVLSEVVRRDKA